MGRRFHDCSGNFSLGPILPWYHDFAWFTPLDEHPLSLDGPPLFVRFPSLRTDESPTLVVTLSFQRITRRWESIGRFDPEFCNFLKLRRVFSKAAAQSHYFASDFWVAGL